MAESEQQRAARQVQHHFRLWVASWNMAAKEHFDIPSDGRIPDHLLAEVTNVVPTNYDVYVLGVQECVSESLFILIDTLLNQHRIYRRDLKECRVYGRGDGSFLSQKFTGIAIWVRESIERHIRVEGFSPVSLGALQGSKGAAAVAMTYSGSTICFVNVHMSSNTTKEKQKNFRDLMENVGRRLGDKHFDLLEQFHHIIWFGDTNYRITQMMPEEVVQNIADRKIDAIWQADSLMTDLRRMKSFWHFKEPRPRNDFYPTYKKIPQRRLDNPHHKTLQEVNSIYRTKYKEPIYKGGAIHDRTPSFCDRILIHSLQTEKRTLSAEMDNANDPLPCQNGHQYPKCHKYGCIYDYWTGSDHTGVYCGFDMFPYRLLAKTPREMNEDADPRAYVVTILDIQAVRGNQLEIPVKFRVLFPAPFEDGNTSPQSKQMRREYLEELVTLTQRLKQIQEDREFSPPSMNNFDTLTPLQDLFGVKLPQSESLLKQEIDQRKRLLSCAWAGNPTRPAEANLHCLFRCTFRDGTEGQGVIDLNIDEVFNQDPNVKQKICREMALTQFGLPLFCPRTIPNNPSEIKVIVKLECYIGDPF